MEKAKLTREQAKALEDAKEAYEPEEMIGHRVRESFCKEWYGGVAELSVDTLCRALYVGIEIVEEDQTVVVTAEMREELKKARNDVLDFRRLEKTADARTWYAKGIGRALEILGVEERR